MTKSSSTDEAATTTTTAPTSTTPTTTKIITSLDELPPLPQYRAILLDQFGVLHDGQKPYPGSIEATRHLAVAQKRKLVLLSNSSRRAAHALDRLAGGTMGFRREWFRGAVTSGEVAHRLLEARAARERGERSDDASGPSVPSSSLSSVVDDEQGQPLNVASLKNRCFHITWGARGAVSIRGLGLELVDDPRDADFILAHGTEAIGTPSPEDGGGGGGDESSIRPVSLRELRETLERAAEERGRSVPFLCANPDLVTVDGGDALRTMPGTLARWYGAAGGRVVLLGKPGPAIYSAAAALLSNDDGGEGGGEENDESKELRLLAIGDSLEHDVAGAAGAPRSVGRVDSLFVVGGIHASELGVVGVGGEAKDNDSLDASKLEELLRGRPREQRPTFAMAWYRA